VYGLLTVFARIPPKLAVSYPNSMSPTSREKHEKMRIGDIEAMLARRFGMLKIGCLPPFGRYDRRWGIIKRICIILG
jgi:hypothetical protein